MKFCTDFLAHENYVLGAIFTSDSKNLITSGMDNKIKIWDVPSWTKNQEIKAHEHSVNGIKLFQDDSKLISISTDKTAKIWNYPEMKLEKVLEGHKKTVAGLDVSPDNKKIATCSYDNTVKLWNSSSGDEIYTLKGHPKNVVSVSFNHNGTYLASSGLGEKVIIWDVKTGESHKLLSGFKIVVAKVIFLPDKKTLLTISGMDGTASLWDIKDWKQVKSFKFNATGMLPIAFTKEFSKIALGFQHSVKIYHLDTWELYTEFKLKPKGINSLSFSPDGQYFVVGGSDKMVRIWKL